MEKLYTRDQIKDAIWQELKESDYTGENNERAYEVIGIVIAGIDKIGGEARTGAVWVKASDRLPGYEIPVKWRDGNDHTHATNGKIPLIHMAKPFLTGWEWYDESAPSGERELTGDIKEVLAGFIKVARHIRNYPHPQLSIELLRSEAVIAEMKGERILGKDVYDQISELAFKQQKEG